MQIDHPAVRSVVFEMVKTLEFDLCIKGDLSPARLEIFRSTDQPNRYRCRLWERNLYHLKPTLNLDALSEEEFARDFSDEEVLVERTWELSERFLDFEAANESDAILQAVANFEAHLSRPTTA